MAKNTLMKNDNNDDAVNQLAKMLMEKMNESVSSTIAGPVNELKDGQKHLEERMDKLETDETIESKQQGAVQRAVSDRVYVLLKGESPKNRKKYSGTFFRRLYSSLKRTFCIPSYRDIRKTDFDTVLEIIDTWEPYGGVQALKNEIDEREDEES